VYEEVLKDEEHQLQVGGDNGLHLGSSSVIIFVVQLPHTQVFVQESNSGVS
jgi:hypothetical protein